MFKNDKIIINEIIFVNRSIGNEKGSHTEFKTDHIHHYQLLYKLSGEAIISFDRKKVTEKADNLRFLPNPTDFKYSPLYTADVVEKGESINIGFTSYTPLPKEIIVKSFDNSALLKQLFHKLQRCWYYKSDGYYYECMSIFYDILSTISKNEVTYIPSEAYAKILPAIEYIDNHFTDKKIDCDYLAHLCNISHVYMTRLFNKRFGMSPNKYIITKKLEYACDLLNIGQYNIVEIADKIGFANVYYFSRIFKKQIGCCPSKYTKNAHL